jgi:Predicted EndoIII-related endonuclease
MEIDQSEERVRDIYSDLIDVYGKQDDVDDEDGLRQLLITILSQNVADENTSRAAENLFNEFKDYSEIEQAEIQRLADTINPAGLPQTKAERIQRTLKAVREESGGYSVDFLSEMEEDDAQDWLEDIKGIGPKTASILMNFHFDADVIPVDTHVERISKRFRLVPFSASNQKTHDIMNEVIPHELKHQMHMLMIQHGKTHCTARNPDCGETKLREHCSHYQLVQDGDLASQQYPPESLK